MTSITHKSSTTRLDGPSEVDVHVHVRRPGCPAWCVEDHATPAGDDEHVSEIHGVELAAHTVTIPDLNGAWGTYPLEMLATIEINDGRPPHIVLTGHDDETTSNLTAGEADQLADVLHTLAATLRSTHP